MVEGSEIKNIPEWVNWPHLVDIAEHPGAHKDMFHVDMFVGVPAGSPTLQKEANQSERKAAVQHVVSKVSLTSSEPLPADILKEATCLWIAGYKLGNYLIVPNTEVLVEFQETCIPPTVCFT